MSRLAGVSFTGTAYGAARMRLPLALFEDLLDTSAMRCILHVRHAGVIGVRKGILIVSVCLIFCSFFRMAGDQSLIKFGIEVVLFSLHFVLIGLEESFF